MAYNADDPKQVKRAKKQAEFDEAMKFDVIRSVMGTIPGRRWIYDMLERCYIYRTPFILGQPDGTAFNCGEQNFGNKLLADVQNAAPDQYLAMIQEAKSSSA